MPEFEAPNPNFEKNVTQVVGSMPAARYIGFEFAKVEPGLVQLNLSSRAELLEHQGSFQGGIIGALIDFAGAAANGTLLPQNHMLVTLDYSVKLHIPAKAKTLIAIGHVLSAGRSISTATVSIWNDSEEDMLSASGLVTTKSSKIS